MKTSRRLFLRQSALATTGSLLIPNFLKALEIQPGPVPASDKILVIVQLSGGNDGLNTVIPYRNDLYYSLRPKLALPKSKILTASDELGFNGALTGLKELYDRGYLTVINNVGYPNPNRSHFRSMDIWQSASGNDVYIKTGWIGRYLDASCQNCNVAHQAFEMDDSLSLALKGNTINGLAAKNPEKLYRAMHNDFFQHLTNDAHDGSSKDYLYKTLAETISSAEYIYDKSKIQKSVTEYPKTEFALRMKTIAELIIAGLDTRVYYVSMTGFDTHAGQVGRHERLLQTYAGALSAFVRDLEKSNRFDDVMVMTFSEFGRRVAENASGGTDHGAANNIFLVGKNMNKQGFYNTTPDLAQLEHGDLIHQVDFRSVYTTLLNKWLRADAQKVIAGNFTTLDFIK